MGLSKTTFCCEEYYALKICLEILHFSKRSHLSACLHFKQSHLLQRKKREVALCKDMWWLDVPEIKIVVNSWNPEGETDSAWMNSKALSKRAIHFLAVWKLRKLAGEGLPGICFLKEDFCWESPDQGYPSDVPCSRLGRAEVWVEFPFLPSAPCDSEHLFNLLGLRFPWVKWK